MHIPKPPRIGVDNHPIFRINGQSFGTPYEPPKYTGPEPKAVEGGKLYTGSCHCGAVKVAMNTLPLDKNSTQNCRECNCSICNKVSTGDC